MTIEERIEYAKEKIDFSCREFEAPSVNYWKGYRDALEDALKDQTNCPRPGWTPCAEGLPKEEYAANKDQKRYVVTTKDGHGYLETTIATRRYYESYFDRDSGRIINKEVFWYDEMAKHQIADWNKKVTAWQPLPAPYNPDTAKEGAECKE